MELLLKDWDSIEPNDQATLVLTHDNRLVDVELNPPRMRATNQLLVNLMQRIWEITKEPRDPQNVKSIGNRLFDQFFSAHRAVQIDTKNRDLFVYYPYSPDSLGKIPYELIQNWGSERGVLRLPNGKPTDAHAATLRRLLAAFRAPAKFRLLIVVHLNQKWNDVDPVLNEWLARLPEGVEPEIYLGNRATPSRVKNLIAAGGYDAIYFIANHQRGRLDLHEGKLDLKELPLNDNPLIFLNPCEATHIDSKAVEELLEGGAGFVINTLNKVDPVEAIKFGGLFFEALFGSSIYHDYLSRTEHFGLRLPDSPLSVARAISWARKCFEKRSGVGWSYVVFAQPDARKLEKLIQDIVIELRRHGHWKAVIEILLCIRTEEQVSHIVQTEVEACLATRDWDKIKEMLELPSPHREDLREWVVNWAEKNLAKHERRELIDGNELFKTLLSDVAERPQKARHADQNQKFLRQDHPDKVSRHHEQAPYFTFRAIRNKIDILLSTKSSTLPRTKSSNLPRALRVFLCHSSNDKPAVRKLYRRLLADKIDPWLDEEKLLPGQEWELEIPKAVRNADVVIVCLSPGSVNKAGYVQKEIKYALDVADLQPEGTIFLIPLRLEECQVPDRLSNRQWVNFFEENGYSKLLKALGVRAQSLGVQDPPARNK